MRRQYVTKIPQSFIIDFNMIVTIVTILYIYKKDLILCSVSKLFLHLLHISFLLIRGGAS